MSFTHKLTLEDIRRTDAQDMGGLIAHMGDHVREAVGLADAALTNGSLPKNVTTIVVAGMGGSAIGGDFVRSYLGPALRVPIIVNRSYELPAFANENTLVIASSYSGNTEETLAMFEQAQRQNCSIICITTGGKLGDLAKQNKLVAISQRTGMQPRAAFAYSFVPILLILDALGVTSGERENLERAAALLDTLAERYGTSHLDDANAALSLASQLMHRVPVIYSSVDYEAVCLRWRGQIQENAKHIAFGNLLPEMNHNELESWSHPADVIEHFFAILLRSADEHTLITKRLDFVKRNVAARQVPVSEVHAEGNSRLERMISLISLADWTSYYLALLAGTDPTPIPVMTSLKQILG